MRIFNINTKQKITTDSDGIYTDKGYVAHIQISADNAVATSNTAILEQTALIATAQSVIENIINPAVPRNIKVVGNAAGITGNVVIKGTNYNSITIEETIALNGTTAVEGSKAFRTITEIELPTQTNAGDTVSIGFGEKLGLPYKLSHNTVLTAYLDNIKETTEPTVTTDSNEIEGNTIKLNSALSGKIIDVYLIV